MAFIEKQRHGKHIYYYLVKNVRLSPQKVKTFRVSLGRTVPSHGVLQSYFIRLEKKARIYEAKLLPKDVLEKLEDLRASIIVFHKTPEGMLPKDFLVRFTYNSNAIEGNRLTLRQTALVLAEGIAPEGTRTNDIIEAFNSRDAWEYVKGYRGGLTDRFIRKLQYEVTKNTSTKMQGKYRDGPVRISGSAWIPPEAAKVLPLIKEVLVKYKKEKTSLHPVELASWLHNRIVQIHPFTDGNGRASRFLMNWVLLRNKFPPVVIEVSNKEKYYRTIEEADRGNEKTFAEFLAAELLKQYTSEINADYL